MKNFYPSKEFLNFCYAFNFFLCVFVLHHFATNETGGEMTKAFITFCCGSLTPIFMLMNHVEESMSPLERERLKRAQRHKYRR